MKQIGDVDRPRALNKWIVNKKPAGELTLKFAPLILLWLAFGVGRMGSAGELRVYNLSQIKSLARAQRILNIEILYKCYDK